VRDASVTGFAPLTAPATAVAVYADLRKIRNQAEVTQNRLGDIAAFLVNEALPSAKKGKATAEADALDQATLRELYCRYTVACSPPFSHVKHPAFRDFIRGENMAEAIMEFIREYGIPSRVGYFMMENASNMNTMIDKVSDDLEHEFEVFYDPLPHRLRGFGHIINLAVMEFLVRKRPPTTDSYHGPSDEEVEQWRKRGAIGRLHNIVVYTLGRRSGEPVIMVTDPLKWCPESAQRRRFPNFMSTEIERLFSKARLMVTD
ncbi:Ribonuclease H-like protein, partial [Tolypocladium paradoxum]